MSGQGSNASDSVARVEVYLDEGPEAVEVLTARPFRFRLDTTALTEGEHTLRIVRIDAAGNRRQRRIPFVVEQEAGLEVEGLEPGSTVSGRVDVDVVAGGAAPPPPVRRSGPSPWLYILSTIVVLGGIWVFFLLVPIYSHIAPTPAGSGKTASAASSQSSTPVDQAFLAAGKTLYASDCAMCHMATGKGNPPTFPALAGDNFLADAGAVAERIYSGKGGMPSHHSYTAKQLAEVATYIRNTWGNSYGGVTVAEVSKAVPQASGGSSSGNAGGRSSQTSTSAATKPSAGSSGSAAASPPSSSTSSTSGAAAASASTASSAPSASSAPAVDKALLQEGGKLYSSDCSSCHMPNGAGMPPTFPALAGDSFLADPAAAMQRVFDGKGAMPAHPSFSAKDLAAVTTYIRNSFGNSYGGVTVAQAEKAVPKAAH